MSSRGFPLPPSPSSTTSSTSTSSSAKKISRSIITYRISSMRSSLCPRTTVVERIAQRALDYNVVLVRGTPASGKSTVCQLLKDYFELHYPDFRIVEFENGLLDYMNDDDGSPSVESINTEVKRRLMGGLGYDPLTTQPLDHTILLIDEAQSTYRSLYFWNSIVKRVDTGTLGKFTIIMFSSYGSASNLSATKVPIAAHTPPVLEAQQRIEMQWLSPDSTTPPVGLLLTFEESMDLLHRSCLHHIYKPVLTDDLKQELCDLSGGHAGVLAGLFKVIVTSSELLRLRRKGTGYIIDHDSFAKVYMTEPTFELLRSKLFTKAFSRGLPTSEFLREHPDISHILRVIISQGGSSLKEIQDALHKKMPPKELLNAMETCWVRGFLHKIQKEENAGEEVLLFPSKVHAWHASSLLFSSPARVS